MAAQRGRAAATPSLVEFLLGVALSLGGRLTTLATHPLSIGRAMLRSVFA